MREKRKTKGETIRTEVIGSIKSVIESQIVPLLHRFIASRLTITKTIKVPANELKNEIFFMLIIY